MDNPKVVFSEHGIIVGAKTSAPRWIGYTANVFSMLKDAAKINDGYLNLYKVVKKRRKRPLKKSRFNKIKRMIKMEKQIIDKAWNELVILGQTPTQVAE